MKLNEEQKKKMEKTSSTVTGSSVVGEIIDTAADIVIIDSLIDLAGEIVSGLLD